MNQIHSTQSFYGDDLAYVHAQGFANYWDGAADWLAKLARAPHETPFVVDIGCGDGRMLSELRRRNIGGCGFDISESFVHAARARGLVASVGDATSLNVPEATLVIALGEVLAYCSASGEVALEHIIRSAADSLVPGGFIVFDVTSPEMSEGAGWSEGDGWFVASRIEIIDQVQLERRIAVFIRDGDVWRRTNEVHRQMLLDSAKVDGVLHECGLIVEHISTVGGVKLLPGRKAYLARKKH